MSATCQIDGTWSRNGTWSNPYSQIYSDCTQLPNETYNTGYYSLSECYSVDNCVVYHV